MYTNKKRLVKSHKVVDEAWDNFAEYIGENKLTTPLTLKEFENIFNQLNKEGKYTGSKNFILKSFQNDAYAWPLVEKDS